MLLMASLPFDRFYSHLILISYAIHTIIHLDKKAIKPVFTLRILVLQSVFFITFLSTAYAANKTAAFADWGKQIAILIIPILFCLNPIDLKKYRSQLLLSFALVCTATIIYLYADALFIIRYYHLPLKAIFSAAFTNHNFSYPINIHATFFSMQVALAMVYLMSALIKARVFYVKLLCTACCIILAAGLIQLSSKSVFLAVLLVIDIALPYLLLKGAARKRFIIIAGTLSLLLISGIFISGTFRERYVNMLRTDLTEKSINGTDTRMARWKVSLSLIQKKPMLGYGAGSEIQLLQDAFFNKKMYNSFLNKLNTHSQYLSFLLKSGVAGLLIYLSVLAFGFRTALKRKDLLLFSFLILITAISVSENVFDVDKGIFFYAFFFPFFMFSGGDQVKSPEKSPVTKILKSEATKRRVVSSYS